MLSIQEIVTKTSEQRKTIEDFMDQHGYFDASEVNIYQGLKRSIQREINETLHHATLKELLTSGTTAGGDYLVPTYLSQKLHDGNQYSDLTPLISADVFEMGGSGRVLIAGNQIARATSEFGSRPSETLETVSATLTMQRIEVPIGITNELLEDNEYGLMDYHIKLAGQSMGREASDLALNVLRNAPDGVGTANTTTTAGSAVTLYTEVLTMVNDLGVDGFIPDTMVITPQAWLHSVCAYVTATYYPTSLRPREPAPGFELAIHLLDTKLSASQELCTGGGDQWHDGVAMTLCKTLIFCRKISMVTARKGWLRIDRYSDPVADLSGAVVSGRQDSVTTNKYSIGILTEKA